MIRVAAISLALAVLPQATLAEAPPLPSCQEGGFEWLLGSTYPNGMVSAERISRNGASTAYLLSCQAGRAVEAQQNGGQAYAFWDLMDGMMQSSETYSFADLAKLSREAGWSANVVNLDKGTCICGLSY
ncbi:hypothetical protein [Maritimibacter sp. DP1N21-5]|uniref:hypothetical protein n=1 Tax=Maritimibacter sp. DP1N21-5 TaxID=2836867 RepID=UPI001C46DE7E|nr:hypothetical protein [Maritimibacter sp. DP1N21-5]MBV7409460.1 hypothetical protein [Maritimibacter sp. DP1N21-5]